MKVPNHALSHTHKNSILSTLSSRHNDLRSVWINPKTAAVRGISNGDLVEIDAHERNVLQEALHAQSGILHNIVLSNF